VKAVETIDDCLGRILRSLRHAGGIAIVTADHGNAEQMWDDQLKSPHTAHTSNPVPVILVDEHARGTTLREGGSLRDVAPTMLGLLGVELPREMTGRDLREK
jgi:2,3-bisphosphoglycerate-independent phosphoglycerate mutase